MPFPTGVQTVTVTAPANGYRTLDGDYQQGTVTLTPSVLEVVSAEHGIIAVGEINFTIGASGMFTPRAVLPNDAEGFLPTGWTYRLDQNLTGEPPRSYNVSIPASAGTVDLSTLVEVTASNGTLVSVPVTAGTPSDTVTADTGYGQAASAGVAVAYSRGDHTHGSPSLATAAPAVTEGIGTAAAAGTASVPARADHVHPMGAAGVPGGSAVGDSAATGSAATFAASDHRHGRESFGTVTAQTSFGAASASGVASTPARSDHTHGTPSLPSASTTGAGVVQLDGTAADIAALGAQAAGSTGLAADAGHVHPTSGLVLLTGDQVIDGEKTFNTAIPVLPAFDAAFANQAIRKAQLDAAIAGVSGGSAIRTAKVRITDDNLSGLPAASAWTIVQTSGGTLLECAIAAVAGDRIRVCGNFMYVGAHFLDWVLLDSAGVIALYAGSETSSPLAEGNPAMYPSLSFSKMTASEMFTVSSGHINAGQVTIALAHQGTSSGTVYAHTTYPWRLRLENIGPEPV